jgi:hypothetical protein
MLKEILNIDPLMLLLVKKFKKEKLNNLKTVF